MGKLIRVGIVDDHVVVREGLRTILDREPAIEVIAEATDGRAALERAREGGFDIMLLDINLPEMDGLEVARRRREEKLPFEIVLLTMHCEKEVLDQAIELGIRGYVLKESAASDVARAVRTVHRGGQFYSAELSELMMARYWASEPSAEPASGLHLLTEAERRVLRLIASDRTTKEIADDLELSPRTVDSHRTHICAKLRLRGRHSLLKFAFENRARLL